MMMRKHDKGEPVRKLQLQLLRLGYPLPRWGADGDLGDETLTALALLMRDTKGASVDDRDDVVSDNEIELVDMLVSLRAGMPTSPTCMPGRFEDRRHVSSAKWIEGPRAWRDVTGITLHQTACQLGEYAPRWDNVGAHIGTTRGGRIIWLHDFNLRVVHGNGWNTRCVGIEMDGLYPGVDGNPRTVWDDPSTKVHEVGLKPTPEIVEAAKASIRFVCARVAGFGGKVSKLVAHRQASGSRENDPGSALWQAVALPMMKELDLDDGGPGFALHDGRGGKPIPEAWDPSRKGILY